MIGLDVTYNKEITIGKPRKIPHNLKSYQFKIGGIFFFIRFSNEYKLKVVTTFRMAQLIKSPNLYRTVFGTGNCSIRARDLLFNRGFFFSFFNSFFLICFLLSFFSLVMKNINT